MHLGPQVPNPGFANQDFTDVKFCLPVSLTAVRSLLSLTSHLMTLPFRVPNTVLRIADEPQDTSHAVPVQRRCLAHRPWTCPGHPAKKKGSQGLTFCLLAPELSSQTPAPRTVLCRMPPCLPCVTVDFSRYVQRGFLDWMQVEEAELDFKKRLWGVSLDSWIPFQQLALVTQAAAAPVRVEGKCSFF